MLSFLFNLPRRLAKLTVLFLMVATLTLGFLLFVLLMLLNKVYTFLGVKKCKLNIKSR